MLLEEALCPTLRLIGSSFKEFLISALLEEAAVGLLRLRSLEKRFEASAELMLDDFIN